MTGDGTTTEYRHIDEAIGSEHALGVRTCTLCASAPAADVTLRHVTGLLIVRRAERVEGPFCRDCGTALFRRMMNRTLATGWWSPISLGTNWIAVAGNLTARRRLTRLHPPMPTGEADPAAPGPLTPGRPLYARAGLWITAALGLVVLAVVGAGIASIPERDPTGAIVDGGILDADDLAVGDCLELPEAIESDRLAVVPCDDPHEAEVFATGAIPIAGGSYPSLDDLTAAIARTCVPAFEAYLGEPYETSRLDYDALFPTEDGWAGGYRGYQCFVFDPSGAALRGSARQGG